VFDDDAAFPPAAIAPPVVTAEPTGPASAAVGARLVTRIGCGVLALAGLAIAGSLTTKQVTVRAGDSLSQLAQENGSSVAVIAAQNGIDDPNLIVVGQVLSISDGTGDTTHEVRPGDSLSRIAKIYGSSVSAIVARNQLADADHIRIGQHLIVPGRAPAPTTAATPPTTAPRSAPAAAPPTTAVPAAIVPTTAPPTTLPPTTTVPPTTLPPTTATVPPSVGAGSGTGGGLTSTTWRVQPGDDLRKVASRFKISVTRLALLNALGVDEPLVVGQLLFIPPES
jgi:LysM repeat protein